MIFLKHVRGRVGDDNAWDFFLKLDEIGWAVLSDEQMSNEWPFSLLNDEQMSNKVGVEHQPVGPFSGDICSFSGG